MKLLKEDIIGELVAKDYRSAGVFKKYGIDFCCQGNRTIYEACEKKKIDTNEVLNDLSFVMKQQNEAAIDYKSWPLDLLADYIEKKHHRFVEEKITEIKPYLNKICKVHGAQHPELFEINQHFNTAANELTKHMKKEELILFPYIRKIVKSKQENNIVQQPNKNNSSGIQTPIKVMMEEHDTEGERFRKIAALSNNYNAPENACNTYKVTFALLKEFESDLHLHIHLENNILFPEAIALEKN